MNYPEYTIDKYTLRELILNQKYTEKWCEENSDNPEVVSYLRMTGRLDEARDSGLLFAGRFKGTEKYASALIRLAAVYHWREEFNYAERIYHQAENHCEENDNDLMKGYLYQHQAKMYFDMGDYSRSRFYAEKSLDLRRKINPANTASTGLILNALARVNS